MTNKVKGKLVTVITGGVELFGRSITPLTNHYKYNIVEKTI